MISVATLVTMAIAFATAAVVSIGGIAAMIPEIHRQAVDVYHWMDDGQFATTFAISQIAPGPNILLMSLVGYRAQGLAGLAVSTLVRRIWKSPQPISGTSLRMRMMRSIQFIRDWGSRLWLAALTCWNP